MAYVIAECGVNHNGYLYVAKDMILAAKDAGANAVKFQLFDARKLEPPGPRRDMLEDLELTREDILELKEGAEKLGLEFICTPFDVGSLEFLAQIGCEKVKIGSADCLNETLIRRSISLFDTVIISTGMVDYIEGDFEVWSAADITMHCTSAYPCPLQDANLLAMTKLPKPYGFSDHTLSTVLPAAAVALGAEYIEKHLTLDRNMEGPDHRASIEPYEFAEMVRNIREVEVALGDGIKRPMPSEAAVMKIRDERAKWRQSS